MPKVVIDISDADYKSITEDYISYADTESGRVYKAIKEGTVLPDNSTNEDAISREDALLCLTGENLENYAYDELIAKFARRIKALPPSQPDIDDLITQYCEANDYVLVAKDVWRDMKSQPDAMVEPQERSDKE